MSLQRGTIIRSDGTALMFDAVFEESHDSDLEITDNPVENGVLVSDHAYMKPLGLTISAGVSDAQLHKSDSKDPFATDLNSKNNLGSRTQNAFAALKLLQKQAEPFSIQTGLMLYENMLVKSIKTSQDVSTSSAFIFTAELREVLIVGTKFVSYTPTPAKGAVHQQASKRKDKGEQQGSAVENTDGTEKKKSILSALAARFSK